jgi:DNA-binding response OmpR family regulator
LERFHYKVEVATNGLQAVEFVERYHPHLVFLDIGLPGLSGIDVLKKINPKFAVAVGAALRLIQKS